MDIQLKRTVKMDHKSREGLLKDKNGKVVYDDSWMHPELSDPNWDKKHSAGLKRSINKSVGLYIDLVKGRIDTSKLVKKQVQVHGENGKMFTRMQWVDPNTGQPVSQKKAIDDHVKSMDNTEKYKMLEDHGIKHKHNDHPNILHKNKVEALKNHLYENPHLVGAEEFPKDEAGVNPDGTNHINDWVNNFAKNDREKLYELMSKFNITHIDPKVQDPDDKSHPIKHMRNMMALKNYLKEHPHYMDHPDHQPRGANPKPKPTSTHKTTAELGGNTIEGVLKTMGRKDMYGLMIKYGITDQDPLEANPEDKAAPIKHMHNMMKFKKLVESNPHILNLGENGTASEVDTKRKEGMDEDQKHVQNVKDMVANMSQGLKTKLADSYADHPHMKNRIQSEHAHIDNMHKVAALRKILEENPDLYEKHKVDADKEKLMTLTIGNKNMGKVLRHFISLKGVGDVKNVEPGVEWSYETGFVRREEDDAGNPILSVVDNGKDGEDWNEHTIDLREVRDFLGDTLKSMSDYEIINWGW